jgi:hypothetical protein
VSEAAREEAQTAAEEAQARQAERQQQLDLKEHRKKELAARYYHYYQSCLCRSTELFYATKSPTGAP